MKLRIHICPVGFEIDRIIIPITQERADRVWLVTKESKPDDLDNAINYIEILKNELDKKKIEYELKCCNISDLNDSLRLLREIILKEKDNDISINVSSGNKVFAIAGMMACMMWDVKPYYVIPVTYNEPEKPMTEGVKKIIPLPRYKIDKPTEGILECLRIIKSKKQGAKKKELISELQEKGFIKIDTKDGKEPSIQAQYRHLEEHILKPAKEWNFITQDGTNRSVRIKLTNDGMSALHIFGE